MADEQGADDPPLISVVVPVRNGMPWLEHQLRALSAQEVPAGWEVMVADNGSDDGTRSCVERWSERDPRIHLVDASARRGAAAARNIGVRSARGQTSGLLRCRRRGATGLDRLHVAGPGRRRPGRRRVRLRRSGRGTRARFRFPRPHGNWDSSPSASSANLAVPREVFEAVHGFDEDLSPEEDVDLCWRLQLAGYRFAVATDAVVEKRERAAGTAHVPCRLGLRAVRAPALRALPLRRACGATFGVQQKRGSGWWPPFPALVQRPRRRQWVRTFAIRSGRLAGSMHLRVFFP